AANGRFPLGHVPPKWKFASRAMQTIFAKTNSGGKAAQIADGAADLRFWRLARLARPGLSVPQHPLETRPPRLRVMRGRSELGAAGAASGREVEAFGVEADRPPARADGFVAGEPHEAARAERVRFLKEPLFGFGERRLAPGRSEDVGRRERGGAAEAAVEMHVLDPEAVEGEIGEAGVERGLGIAPDTGPWRAPPDSLRSRRRGLS